MKRFPANISAVLIVFMIMTVFTLTVSAAETSLPAEDQESAEQVYVADKNAYVYGLTGYAEHELLGMSLPKKSVAYVAMVVDGYNNPKTEENIYEGNYYRFALAEAVNSVNPHLLAAYGNLGGITYDYFSEAGEEDGWLEYTDADSKEVYHVIELKELLMADIIVCPEGVSIEAMVNTFRGIHYSGVIISDVPEGFLNESEEAKEALGFAYYLGCAYSEIFNPVDLCAFYYEHFYGINDRAALEERILSAFAGVTFYRGYANTVSEGYNAAYIESMIRTGAWFYTDNRALFSVGPFEANGMSVWEPDFYLEDSLLYVGGEEVSEAETEQEETQEVTAARETEMETSLQQETTNEQSETTEQIQEEKADASWVSAAIGALVTVIAIVILIIYLKKKAE